MLSGKIQQQREAVTICEHGSDKRSTGINEVKVKLSLRLIKHYAIKTY